MYTQCELKVLPMTDKLSQNLKEYAFRNSEMTLSEKVS
jgi:hypothetical protein